MAMTSMKLPKKGAKDSEYAAPAPMDTKGPEYPYGLLVRLENDSLKKLKITKMPAVGKTMKLEAMVTVTSCHENRRVDGEQNRCVELQITDMAVGNAAELEAAEGDE